MDESPKPPKISESSVQQPPPSDAKPVKEKKPRTEAQKQATVKALAAMTAKRKELNEKAKEKKEEVKKAKKIVEEKILKEDLRFASMNDVESLKKEIYELKGLLTAKQQTEKEKPAPKAERVVERVIERVPTPVVAQQKLTGYELLDKVFFSK